jgi:hypothetical protein
LRPFRIDRFGDSDPFITSSPNPRALFSVSELFYEAADQGVDQVARVTVLGVKVGGGASDYYTHLRHLRLAGPDLASGCYKQLRLRLLKA